MNSHEEFEQIEFSRAERMLALALVVFLFIGGLWVLDALRRVPNPPNWETVRREMGIEQAQQDLQARWGEVEKSRAELDRVRQEYELADREYQFRREEYRTSLDRGVDDPAKRAAYEAAQRARAEAEARLAGPQARFEASDAARREAEQRLQDLEKAFQKRFEVRQRSYETWVLALRLLYGLPVFGLSLIFWQRLRRRNKSLLVIGTAFLAFAALQLAWIGVVYVWVVLRDFSQLVVSVGGAGLSIAGIVWLRRTLFAPERLGRDRWRRGQCPNCGFPAYSRDPAAEHCPSCGSPLYVKCGQCGERRPTVAAHCPHCGQR